MKIRRWFDSIAKKNVFMIIGAGLVTMLLSSIALPGIFYQIMNSHISSSVASMINISAIRQSYIWKGSKAVFSIYSDPEMPGELERYYNSIRPEEKDEAKAQLLSRLPTQRAGKDGTEYIGPGEGAITAVTYTMLCTDRGDAFYREEAAAVAETVLNSQWFQGLEPDMERVYSPVLTGGNLTAVCFVIPFYAGDMGCYAVHMMDFRYIREQFASLEKMGIEDYVLLQGDRVLYQHGSGGVDLEAFPTYMYEGGQYQVMVKNGRKGMDFMALCSYSNEDLRMAAHADRHILLKPYVQIIFLFKAFLFGVIAVFSSVILLTQKKMLGKLTRFSHKMDLVKQGDYDVSLDICSNDEIGNLAQTFNLMIQTIKDDIDNKVKSEQKEQQMQYSLLVSAIAPHFIYNTLDTITFLAKMGKTEEVVQVNKALINILFDRLTIKNCKIFDSVHNEKEVLDQYMVIQHYLCHNKIDYYFEVEDGIEDVEIPKNIIQPFVENGIKHGLLPHKDPVNHEIQDGLIRITVNRQQGELFIEIRDNGIGMAEEEIKARFESSLTQITETDSEHIGIYNIRMRLAYLYENRYKLSASSRPGEGTVVTLRLPVRTPAVHLSH